MKQVTIESLKKVSCFGASQKLNHPTYSMDTVGMTGHTKAPIGRT